MRIQARYWDCMRGLAQQQLKVLAAAAARQEQLAAMKARRSEGAAAGGGGGEGGDEEATSPRSHLYGGNGGHELDMDGGLEEGDALLGGMHLRHTRPPPPGLDGLDEETDTPHQRECGARGGLGPGGAAWCGAAAPCLHGASASPAEAAGAQVSPCMLSRVSPPVPAA